jgi:hypothetical protein
MIGLALPPRRTILPRQLRGAFLLLLLQAAGLPDDCCIEADGTRTVSPGPAMQPRAVAGRPKVGAMHATGGFPLQPPYGCATL